MLNIDKIFLLLIYFLSIYLPFEDFILKFLPVPEKIYLFLRQIPDILVFSLFLFLLFSKLFKSKLYIPNKAVTYFFVLFLFYFILQLVYINPENKLSALLNLKSLVRYIFIIFIILNIKIYDNDKFILKIVKTIIIISIIESIIGLIEFFGGNSVKQYFFPREITQVNITFTALKTSDVFGTMAYTISFAYFQMIGLILTLFMGKFAIKHNFIRHLFLVLLFISIILSGSRIVIILSIIIILYKIFIVYGKKVIPAIISFLLLSIFIGTSLSKNAKSNEDFWFFLTPKFWEMVKHQRLGLIENVFLPIFKHEKIIFGFSSDKEFFVKQVQSISTFFGDILFHIIEDVYWFTLIGYYGILGFSFFLLFLIFLYIYIIKLMNKNYKNDLNSKFFYTIKILFLSYLPLNLFNQAFEVRTLTFYTWLLIGIYIKYMRNKIYESASNK